MTVNKLIIFANIFLMSYPLNFHHNFRAISPQFSKSALFLKKKYTSAQFENPPFFPITLEELAEDASFSTKVALISRISRMRIDLRMRLISRERFVQKWLILLALNLIDEEITRVHIYLEGIENVDRCNEMWQNILQNSTELTSNILKAKQEKMITFSPISDIYLDVDDKLIIIFNPDNISDNGEERKNNSSRDTRKDTNILEEVQALCFHSALQNIPVVMINPNLIATAWNDFGARPPMLLSDFAQIYFACDSYFMSERKDQWYGIVQRAATGFDLFLLEGSIRTSPKYYKRVETWPDGLTTPDITATLSRRLLNNPNFYVNDIHKQNQQERMKGIGRVIPNSFNNSTSNHIKLSDLVTPVTLIPS